MLTLTLCREIVNLSSYAWQKVPYFFVRKKSFHEIISCVYPHSITRWHVDTKKGRFIDVRIVSSRWYSTVDCNLETLIAGHHIHPHRNSKGSGRTLFLIDDAGMMDELV